MSKFSKLYRTPVKYFLDARLFRSNDLKEAQKATNLFVIAHYGQLHQVENLIKFEGLTDNLLCILYTDANLRMPELIQESYNKSLFASVVINRLPIRPNSLDIENIIYIQRSYKKLLSKVSPTNLYLLSFEAHYSLLASYANAKSIKCHLIEEGTGSYKFDDKGNNLSPVILPVNGIKNKVKRRALSLSPYRYFLQVFKNFDHVYCAFPEVMACGFPSSNYTKYFLHAEGSKDVPLDVLNTIKHYSFDKDSTIFVSQRYGVNQQDYISSIINSLISFNKTFNSPIYIKLHPKETLANKKLYEKLLARKSVNSSRICVIQDNEFLVEDVISIVKPFCIIGISSTSLVYTSLVSSTTKCISIAPYVISELERLGNSSNQSLQIIKSHYDIVQKFPDIITQNCVFSDYKQLNKRYENKSKSYLSKVDINLIDATTQKINDGSYSDALQLIANNSRPALLLNSSWLKNCARLYYKQGKTWKSYCYYTWAMQGNDYLCSSLEGKEYLDLAYSLFDMRRPILPLVNFLNKVRQDNKGSTFFREDVVALNVNALKYYSTNSDLEYIYNDAALLNLDTCPVSRVYYILFKDLLTNSENVECSYLDLEAVMQEVVENINYYGSYKIEILENIKSLLIYLSILSIDNKGYLCAVIRKLDHALYGQESILDINNIDAYIDGYIQLDTKVEQSRFTLIENEQLYSAYYYHKGDIDKAYGYIRVKEKAYGKNFVSDKLAFKLNVVRASYKKALFIYSSISAKGYLATEEELLNIALFQFYTNRNSKNLFQMIKIFSLYKTDFSIKALKSIADFLFSRKRYILCAEVLSSNLNNSYDEDLVIVLTKSLVFTKQYITAMNVISNHSHMRSTELTLINIKLSILVDDVDLMKSAWLKLLEIDSSEISKDELKFYSQLRISHNQYVKAGGIIAKDTGL